MKLYAILNEPFLSSSFSPFKDFENLLTTLPLAGYRAPAPLNLTFPTPSILLTISSFPPFSWHCDEEIFT